MTKEQLEQLEKDVKEEFLKRKPIVEAGLKSEIRVDPQTSSESTGNRGDNDADYYFNDDLDVNYAESGLNMYNYIKLIGKLIPCKFLSVLINKIKKEFINCDIKIVNKKKPKFDVIFNEEEDDNDDDEEEELEEETVKVLNQNIKGKTTIIQVKLYQNYNEEYLLRFVKKEGELKNYLDKLKRIYSLIKKK